MELARIDLEQMAIVHDAAPFAATVQQVLPEDTWADLTDRGYPGIGYWPIVDVPATFNPLTQELGAPALTLDQAGKRVTRTPAVVDLPTQQAAQNQARATYAALLAGGLAITSTATPALDGTYAVDPATQGKLTAVATYIQRNDKFPGGVTAMPMLLANGTAAVAQSTAQYLAVASAIADFVTDADIALDTGSGQWPPTSVTIA